MSNTSLDDYDVVVKCPATLLFFGEYSAIKEQPAIAIALPLYLRVGMSLRKNHEVLFKAAYPSPLLQYGKLREFRPRDEEMFKTGLGHVGRSIKAKLLSLLERSGQGLDVRAEYGIPIKCGLGSSGALCSALSIGIHALLYGLTPEKLDDILRGNMEEILKSRTFRSIFELACKLEDRVHTPSSGVAPFVSLVGSQDALPIFYFSSRRKGKLKYHAARLSELEGIDRDTCQSFLWEDCGFVALYSGIPREAATEKNVKDTMRGIEKRVELNVKELKNAFNNINFNLDLSRVMAKVKGPPDRSKKYVLDGLWTTFGLISLTAFNQFLSGDVDDIKRMMWTAQDLLSFLRVSIEDIDDISAIAKSHKIGCKILGSGKGGDVLLFAEREALAEILGQVLKEMENENFPQFDGTMHFNSLAINKEDRYTEHAQLTRNFNKESIEISEEPLKHTTQPIKKASLKVIPLHTTKEQLDPHSRRFKEKELEKRSREVERTLKKCIELGVDIVVYPEYSVPEESLSSIQDLVAKDGKIIVIAGTHFSKEGTGKNAKWYNRCPIVIPGEAIVYQDKICDSPKEFFHIEESCVLKRITGSRIGDFCVNVCAGFRLNIPEFSAHIRDRLDFMFVPSLNMATEIYSRTAKAKCVDYYTHIVMANSEEFGESGLWGPFRNGRERAFHLTKGQKTMKPFQIDLERFRNVWDKQDSTDQIYKTPEAKARRKVS